MPSRRSSWIANGDGLLAVVSELLRPMLPALENTVSAVLNEAGAMDFAPQFLKQEVTSEVLFTLSNDDLKELRASTLGARKRLLLAIQERKRACKGHERVHGRMRLGYRRAMRCSSSTTTPFCGLGRMGWWRPRPASSSVMPSRRLARCHGQHSRARLR
jgi:hypothetical protein